MSGDPWHRFLAGFDVPGPNEEQLDPSDVLVQIDALRDECRERGDPNWFPPGRDPEGLEKLVRRKVAQGWRPRARLA